MKQTLIIAALVIVLSGANAQTKIGNITTADSAAKKFFFYCYKNADTVWARYVPNEGLVSGIIEARDYNKQIGQTAIAHGVTDSYLEYFIVPKQPTELLFIKWINTESK